MTAKLFFHFSEIFSRKKAENIYNFHFRRGLRHFRFAFLNIETPNESNSVEMTKEMVEFNKGTVVNYQ